MAQGHVTVIAFVVSCLGGTLLGEVSLTFFLYNFINRIFDE